MQKAFYYLRNWSAEGSHPYACVCLLKAENGKIARGISVCSPNDHFTKQIGRNKAYGYALKAMNSNEDVRKRLPISRKINMEIFYMVGKNGCYPNKSAPIHFDNRHYAQSSVLENPGSETNPEIPLTDFEKSLLDN